MFDESKIGGGSAPEEQVPSGQNPQKTEFNPAIHEKVVVEEKSLFGLRKKKVEKGFITKEAGDTDRWAISEAEALNKERKEGEPEIMATEILHEKAISQDTERGENIRIKQENKNRESLDPEIRAMQYEIDKRRDATERRQKNPEKLPEQFDLLTEGQQFWKNEQKQVIAELQNKDLADSRKVQLLAACAKYGESMAYLDTFSQLVKRGGLNVQKIIEGDSRKIAENSVLKENDRGYYPALEKAVPQIESQFKAMGGKPGIAAEKARQFRDNQDMQRGIEGIFSDSLPKLRDLVLIRSNIELRQNIDKANIQSPELSNKQRMHALNDAVANGALVGYLDAILPRIKNGEDMKDVVEEHKKALGENPNAELSGILRDIESEMDMLRLKKERAKETGELKI